MYKILIQPTYIGSTGHHKLSLNAYARTYNSIKFAQPFRNLLLRKIWILGALFLSRKTKHLILDFTDNDILFLKGFYSKHRTYNVSPYPNISEKRIYFIKELNNKKLRLIVHTNKGKKILKKQNIDTIVEPSPNYLLDDILDLNINLPKQFNLVLARHCGKNIILHNLKNDCEKKYIILASSKKTIVKKNKLFLGEISDLSLNVLILKASKIFIFHPKMFSGESAFSKHLKALGRSFDYKII
jgi:hypothetical protein